MEFLSAPWWSALLAIILIDLVLAGDNAIVWRRGDDVSPRFRQLTAARIYSTTADTITANVGSTNQSDPDDAVGRDIELALDLPATHGIDLCLQCLAMRQQFAIAWPQTMDELGQAAPEALRTA